MSIADRHQSTKSLVAPTRAGRPLVPLIIDRVAFTRTEGESMANPADRMSPAAGKFYGPDGELHWLTELIGGGSGGSGMAFLHGTIDPTADDGVDGDVWLNTTSGDLFENASGSWVLLMNLVGPTGTDGATGDTGDPGVSVTGATSDGVNITFSLSDGSTFDVPWPAAP